MIWDSIAQSVQQGDTIHPQIKWSSIAQFLGTQLDHTTAIHPQSNGLVEPSHCQLKATFQAHLSSPGLTRDLPSVFLGIRKAPKEDLVCSSAELVHVYDHLLKVLQHFITILDNPVDRTLEYMYFHW